MPEREAKAGGGRAEREVKVGEEVKPGHAVARSIASLPHWCPRKFCLAGDLPYESFPRKRESMRNFNWLQRCSKCCAGCLS